MPSDRGKVTYSSVRKARSLAKIDKDEEQWLEEFQGISVTEAKELNRLLDKLRG